MKQPSASKEKVIQKIKHYCAYQERSHQEVKEKLYGYALYKKDVEEIMALLIEENYLNEQRFAEQFAGSKFRIKKWGKVKIEHELRQKKVSDYNIKHALKQIDATGYLETLRQTASKKWQSLSHENSLQRQAKTARFLIQKGYEPNQVYDLIKQLKADG